MNLLPRSLFALFIVLCAACHTASKDVRKADYVFVYLKRGPESAAKPASERATIQSAHMANMGRLAEAGKLMIAGPYGDPRRDASYRGIFIFDVADVAEARALTASDPAVQAGVLEMELHPLRASKAWRDMFALGRAKHEAAARAGKKLEMADGIRSFALLETQDEASVRKALGGRRVMLAGSFGGERNGTSLLVVDAEDASKLAKELARADSRLRTTTFVEGWWSDKLLAELPDEAGR